MSLIHRLWERISGFQEDRQFLTLASLEKSTVFFFFSHTARTPEERKTATAADLWKKISEELIEDDR